jgi:hypothetical protein
MSFGAYATHDASIYQRLHSPLTLLQIEQGHTSGQSRDDLPLRFCQFHLIDLIERA